MTETSVIDAAAAEFGRHIKAAGWALGLAVASCVEPGTGNGGDPSRHRNDRYGAKVSAQEFGRRSGTSAPRVLRYLDAWKLAAAQGVVAQPDQLTPGDWNDIDHLPEGYLWSDFYAVPAEDAGTRATPGNIGRQMLDNPELAEAAAQGLAAGAIDHVDQATNRDLSKVVDRKIVLDSGTKPRAKPTPRPIDDGEPDDAYWMTVRKALNLLLDAMVKIEHGATPPADIAILMQILVPQSDWDDAAHDLIGDLS